VVERRGLLLRIDYADPPPGSGKTSAWVPDADATLVAHAEAHGGARAAAEPAAGAVVSSRTGLSAAAVAGAAAAARSAAVVKLDAYMTSALSVVVVGASGDLAKKKTYPALLDLFAHGHIPLDVAVVGVARSPLTDEALRLQLRPFLEKLRVDPGLVDRFLARCSYRRMASYEDVEAMGALDAELGVVEAAHPSGVANRLFYFAIPPNAFLR